MKSMSSWYLRRASPQIANGADGPSYGAAATHAVNNLLQTADGLEVKIFNMDQRDMGCKGMGWIRTGSSDRLLLTWGYLKAGNLLNC
jgi:hypothetical protein